MAGCKLSTPEVGVGAVCVIESQETARHYSINVTSLY
jgi:hypothetical protein